MTLIVRIPDAELVTKAWVLTTSVAAMTNNASNTPMVFEAMPKGSPVPSVILTRVGGAPGLADVPYDRARISFSIFGNTKSQCRGIAMALVNELQSLDYTGPVNTASGRMESAQVLNIVWMPDPMSDKPRYVVDALITVRFVP